MIGEKLKFQNTFQWMEHVLTTPDVLDNGFKWMLLKLQAQASQATTKRWSLSKTMQVISNKRYSAG